MPKAPLAALALLLAASPAMAQLALCGNDNKALLENGTLRIAPNPLADTVTIPDLGAHPPRVVGSVQAPHSVVGPPTSVAITPEGIQVSPDHRHVAVVVINGSARAPDHPLHGCGQLVMLRIEDGHLLRVAQGEMGSWGQGVAFNRDGTRVYVRNMVEREIQGFAFDGQRLTALPERIRVDGGPSALRTAQR